MSSTATLTRPQEKTGNWSAIFPNETVTEQQSALFVKKLLAVAVSNITYLRAIFPEHAFGDRCLEDLNLKILRDDSNCPGACQVIKWVKGCFDALEKKYLRMLVIGLYVDPNDPDTVIESYTFKFSYAENGGGVDIYRNNKKVSSAYTTTETKKATIRLLRTIVVLTQSLQSLPDDVMMTMKLLYHDEVTPPDYEPPGFTAAENENFRFDDEPMNIKVGDVNTPFHAVKLRIKTDAKQFEVCDDAKPPETETSNDMLSPEPAMLEETNLALNEEQEQSMEIQDEAYQTPDKVSKKSNGKGNKKGKQFYQSVAEPEVADEAPDKTTPMRPGTDDEAVTAVGSQSSNINGSQEEFGVRCPCGCNEDDGLMILCANCKFWQHGVCFALLKEAEAPERHICHMCALPDDVNLVPTDPHLLGLSDVAVQATCLWRRALQVCTEITRVIPANFSRRLGVEITVAQGLVNRLEKEGYIRVANRGKKLGKIVNSMKLKTEGLPKYFKKNRNIAADKPLSSLSQTTEMDTVDPMMDSVQDANKSSENQKDVENEISKLAQRAEEISLSEKWNTIKEKKSIEDKLNSSQIEQKKPPRSLKRVKSLTDEDTQFDISNSQEKSEGIGYTGRRKKRKASVASRAIMV